MSENVLPFALMTKAVAHLRSKMDEETVEYLKRLYERDPTWGDETTPEQHKEFVKKYGFSVPSPFHFGTGMQIRNCLREVIKDSELPGVDYPPHGDMHNWDDWYQPVVEVAIGVREV